MPLDPGTEAAAITAALRRLAPDPTVVPIIRTSRPFYGARVGDLRAGRPVPAAAEGRR